MLILSLVLAGMVYGALGEFIAKRVVWNSGREAIMGFADALFIALCALLSFFLWPVVVFGLGVKKAFEVAEEYK